MTRLLRLAIALLPLALGAAAAGAVAQEPPPEQEGPRMGPREMRPRESLVQRRREMYREAASAQPPADQGARPISEAVRRVQRSTGGQILGAEQVPFEGRNITRVKYMDDRGRVRYMDDPGTAERRPPRRADNDE